MSTEESTKLVPQLRFPEFLGAPGWAPKELGDCLDYLQPTQYQVSSSAYSDNYQIPVVTAGKTFILGYTNETDGVFKQPLPVIIFDDFTTASQFVNFPFKAKSSAMKILLAKKNSNIKFVYESMQCIEYEVGAHGRHWISAYSKIVLAVPELIEQQRIADCLSSLDELIAAQGRKVNALKTHKKGLMQQLFPREGETQPRLRFPEFEATADWESRRLEDLAKRGSGHTFLYYVLQEMKPIFERNATGSTIKTIGLPFFKELQIAVPTLSEQKRIADCLASLDTLITAATQELDNLKTHKKGLMQQLFPSFAGN